MLESYCFFYEQLVPYETIAMEGKVIGFVFIFITIYISIMTLLLLLLLLFIYLLCNYFFRTLYYIYIYPHCMRYALF